MPITDGHASDDAAAEDAAPDTIEHIDGTGPEHLPADQRERGIPHPRDASQLQAEASRLPRMDAQRLRADTDEIVDQTLDRSVSSHKRVMDFADLPAPEPYRLLTGLVVPRPISWVSTRSPDGVDNLAPHSFFTVASAVPAIVQFTSVGHKDTLRNIEATGEFVINLASASLLHEMNATAATVEGSIDEFVLANLDKEPALMVSPPRVAQSPAALECALDRIIPVGDSFLVLGRVLAAVVNDDALVDGRPQEWVLDPVGRLSGSRYVTYGETVSLPRPD